MSFLIVLTYSIIFYTSLLLGQWLSTKYAIIAKFGSSIYTKKMMQLETSAFFAPLRSAIKKHSFAKAIFVISPLIILKSAVFLLMSLILITPLLLILQGIAMGSLFSHYKKRIENLKALQIITFWQLLSHVIAATFGTLIGLKWLIYKTTTLSTDLFLTKEAILFYVLTIATAFIATYYEAKSLITNHYFDDYS